MINNIDSPQQHPLEIRVTLSTGIVTKFALDNAAELEELFRVVHPNRAFSNPQIIIGGGGSLSVFPTSRVERIDFIGVGIPAWQYVGGAVNVREISESEFRQAYDALLSSTTRRQVGAILLGYSEYKTVSGSHLFWEVHMKAVAMLPLDFKHHIQSLLSTPVLHAQTNEGVAMINTANIVSTTFYPGPPEPPAGSWKARRFR